MIITGKASAVDKTGTMIACMMCAFTKVSRMFRELKKEEVTEQLSGGHQGSCRRWSLAGGFQGSKVLSGKGQSLE